MEYVKQTNKQTNCEIKYEDIKNKNDQKGPVHINVQHMYSSKMLFFLILSQYQLQRKSSVGAVCSPIDWICYQ